MRKKDSCRKKKIYSKRSLALFIKYFLILILNNSSFFVSGKSLGSSLKLKQPLNRWISVFMFCMAVHGCMKKWVQNKLVGKIFVACEEEERRSCDLYFNLDFTFFIKEMPSYCAVGCTNRSTKQKDLLFYRIPKKNLKEKNYKKEQFKG